ncbi:hypothetical protein R7D66_17720 [Vibrio sp. Vb2354]|uniref:hypothetical protein n=1 Tax=unclassified Vibrio TaxID=2614977 RepID=UPI00296481BD|nr:MULTISPECIES: hypothetical protein [unclassified Vibrio]MDW1740769.1 hypothetical protein [Vibrio sp. Vb2321]MDW1759803.1 hypothetical protein [Vibrio sp. Vb2353]MDW1773728.1 hypothetical protein [Vibrio sp. Vb2354]MDW1809363.1 hypothetical protein [Vibrio sp. Vb2362]
MFNSNTIDQAPFDSFEEASRFTLKYLHKKYGFGAWMLTRKNEEDWIILQVESDKYNIKELSTLVWSDSICSRMVQGNGPRWAPSVQAIENYKCAPINQQLSICSYVGIPICYPDGELFGTLCAIDTAVHKSIPSDGQATVELISKLLSSMLCMEIERNTAASRQMYHLPSQFKDAETGFFNRLGWSIFLEKEQSDVRTVGVPLYIIAIDALGILDESGGSYKSNLYNLCEILKNFQRGDNYIARLNDSIFTILVHDINTMDFNNLYHDLYKNISNLELQVKIGCKKHLYNKNLDDTVIEAIKYAQ